MADKVHPDIHWDYEAQQAAMAQAQRIAKRDPEASALLITQLIAVQRADKEQGGVITETPFGYKPAKLYAFMGRQCGWTPQQIDDMHYLTFFSIIREVNDRIAEENEAYKGHT